MRNAIPKAAAPDLLADATETGAQPPMKLSKLQLALNSANASIERVQQMEADIAELERTAGPKIVFAVATKDGYKLADEARGTARKLRLDIKGMRDDGTKLLNTLKSEFWGVTDPAMERLQAIEDNAKAQRDAQDAKEAARKQRHEANIRAIEQPAAGTLSELGSVEIERRLATLRAIVIDDSYEEYEARAAKAAEDSMKALTFALAAALRREEEARELAERRQREERQNAVRLRIADIKNTAADCAGTGLENVEAVIRSLESNPPHADDFDDMLEFAELAHEKALRDLRAMADELRAAAIAEADAQAAKEEAQARRQHADDDGAEVVAADGESEGSEQFAPLGRMADGSNAGTVPTVPAEADFDPFSFPTRPAMPAPRAAAPRPAPARRSTVAAAVAADVAAVMADPAAAETLAPTGHEPRPDLRASAELVVASFDRLPRNVTIEWSLDIEHDYIPDAASLTFTRAIQYLRDALARDS